MSPNQQRKLMKDTNKTQTAQTTKAAIPTEIPYPSRKTTQTGSVAQDSLTPFWWDHVATFPGCVVLPVGYTEGCCSRCRAGLPSAQAGAVRGHCPPLQPVTAVSHPTTHSSHLWAGVAALAGRSPPLAELDYHGVLGQPAEVGPQWAPWRGGRWDLQEQYQLLNFHLEWTAASKINLCSWTGCKQTTPNHSTMSLAGTHLYFDHCTHPFVVCRLLFLEVTQAAIAAFTWSAAQNSSSRQHMQRPTTDVCFESEVFLHYLSRSTDRGDAYSGYMVTLKKI